jgi:hypothetical protein
MFFNFILLPFKSKQICSLNVSLPIAKAWNFSGLACIKLFANQSSIKLSRLTIYYSFILSNFNYCPVTWHFCSEKNTKKMEKIQERALRFIYNDYVLNYEELLISTNSFQNITLKSRFFGKFLIYAYQNLIHNLL